MSVRADRDLQRALIVTRTVEASQTVVVGRVVKDGASADKFCQHSADGVGAYGVVSQLGPLNGAAGDKVAVAMLCGACVIPVVVGTGGATRGKWAKVVSDGVTSATPDVATPAAAEVVGIFTQSGVAGDLIGMIPARGWLTE